MKKDVFDISNMIVVVTGGLGQLGRQYTAELLSRGARVAVWDILDDPGNALEYDGHEKNVSYFCVDVTSRESLEKALNALEEKWGTPHGLVNNAALDSPPGASAEENGPFETYPEKSWDRVMEVNAKGVFLTCQVVGGAMARAGFGSIVNICSTYGLVSPDQGIYEYRRKAGETFFKPVAYSASKSTLVNLTRYLATYWAKKGVRVNTLSLGGVFNKQDSQFLENYCLKTPLGRMANPDEYNGAVVFLLSNASSYMTGANLVVDGGWTAW